MRAMVSQTLELLHGYPNIRLWALGSGFPAVGS